MPQKLRSQRYYFFEICRKVCENIFSERGFSACRDDVHIVSTSADTRFPSFFFTAISKNCIFAAFFNSRIYN